MFLTIFVYLVQQIIFIYLLHDFDFFICILVFIRICLLMRGISIYGIHIYKTIRDCLLQYLIKDFFKYIAIAISSDIILTPGRIIWYLFIHGDSQKPAICKVYLYFSAGLSHRAYSENDIDEDHFKKHHRIYARSANITVKIFYERVDKIPVNAAFQHSDIMILRY